ncbi:MAG: tRNA uridine-5-carboxymethylaminomethyl(34) synthesis GTPase MnmE [Gemmatimonadota bacterium]|nr:tRNA uridine-5-carboxymethylaminomethyl(34) synthesis GTPase MnmE [Gemmatimonadota bacterium]
MLTDPIVALATPPGRSAVAVIRLSGQGAFDIAARVIPSFRRDPPRDARLATFRSLNGAVLDRGLYLVFPGPRSETGEDMVELHSHGGLVVPVQLLAALEAAGARPAHPGEFTRRALMNGKLDLLQAEALADLVDAEAPAQARIAVDQLEGGLSRRIAELRESLINLLALLAYEVDFPDEDDGPLPQARLEAERVKVAAQVTALLATAPLAERVRSGALVVLAGPHNAGKSSLFNALLGRERALVTELPGTTRDAIEAMVDFCGWPVRLVDTAGIGASTDRLDQMGQEVSRRYMAAADLVIVCEEGDGRWAVGGTAFAQGLPPTAILSIATKADLHPPPADRLAVSVVTGQGLDRLRQEIARRLFSTGVALADLGPALTRARHREALAGADAALRDAIPHFAPGGDAVLAAHEVQEAVRALDTLVGSVDIEEVLDRLFASFCVGK